MKSKKTGFEDIEKIKWNLSSARIRGKKSAKQKSEIENIMNF